MGIDSLGIQGFMLVFINFLCVWLNNYVFILFLCIQFKKSKGSYGSTHKLSMFVIKFVILVFCILVVFVNWFIFLSSLD